MVWGPETTASWSDVADGRLVPTVPGVGITKPPPLLGTRRRAEGSRVGDAKGPGGENGSGFLLELAGKGSSGIVDGRDAVAEANGSPELENKKVESDCRGIALGL